MIFLHNSKKEKQGYSEVIDYQMSKKFGLNWRKHDSVRMNEFIQMMTLENEKEYIQNEQYGRPKTTSHNRSQR